MNGPVRSSLVPEVRIDSLGRAITRHVKPIRPGGPAVAVPPLPPAPPKPESAREARVDAVMDAVRIHSGESAGTARRNLTAPGVVEVAERLAGSPHFASEGGRRALRNILSMALVEDSRTMLRAVSVIAGCIEPTQLMRTVAGLKKAPALAPYWETLDEAPPAVQQAAQAAVTVLGRQIATGESSVRLVSVPGCTTRGHTLPDEVHAAADLVLAQPERFDEILPLLKEGVTALQIEGILDGAPRPLAGGYI